ncbi:cytochrome c oxidase accessory protein CcoG [bacterium]|nr:cytochrome c oxidase accessory protein CcoG [bacterium]
MKEPTASNAPGVLASPEDVLTTLRSDGKRRWMYPVESKGRFLNRRRILGWALIVLYFALPLIRIGGKPSVMLDFVHREFALFGLIFYPTDTLLLMIFMVGIMLSIVLITALLGRVWCGWACPQTVYLEFLFRPIERLIEGPEHARKRRDEGASSWDRTKRKIAKQGIFLVLALLLSHTFIAYFVGWEALLGWLQGPPAENWGFFLLTALVTGLVWFDFAYFREQMCTIACPYARMQSIMLDRDSMIVSYDPNRGEPRKRRSKKILQDENEGLVAAQGDCIDCFACVRTCPTGIDIRDGLQMECVTCTQCIDACDHIMDNIGKPRGLIRYTSENQLEGVKTNVVRPRSVIYGVLIILIFSAFSVVLSNRNDYDLNVGRAVGEPFSELPDGRIANRLRFRVRNQTNVASTFDIFPDTPSGTEMRIIGATPIELAPGEMKRVEVWIIIPREAFTTTSIEGHFEVNFSDGHIEHPVFTLLGPDSN